MANLKGASDLFVPTEDQIEIAKRWLDLGFNTNVCSTKIINPETAEPIAPNTFKKVFKKQIREAMHDRLAGAAKCFATAAQTDPDMASRYINTRGRGFFKEKFKFDNTLSYREQIQSVRDAACYGLIDASEMTAFIKSIESECALIIDKILEFLRMKEDNDTINYILGLKDVSDQAKHNP